MNGEPATFAEALRQWETYYFAIGGFSATLAGLAFVATALHVARVQDTANTPLREWVTFSLGHFVQIILISAVVLSPQPAPLLVGLPILLGALVGLAVVVRGMIYVFHRRLQVRPYSMVVQFVFPLTLYLLLALAAFLLSRGDTSFMVGLQFVVIGLMLLGLHNCWLLVLGQGVPGIST